MLNSSECCSPVSNASSRRPSSSSAAPCLGASNSQLFGHRGPATDDVDDFENDDYVCSGVGMGGDTANSRAMIARCLVHHTDTCDTLLLLSDAAAGPEADSPTFQSASCNASPHKVAAAVMTPMSGGSVVASSDAPQWSTTFDVESQRDSRLLVDDKGDLTAADSSREWVVASGGGGSNWRRKSTADSGLSWTASFDGRPCCSPGGSAGDSSSGGDKTAPCTTRKQARDSGSDQLTGRHPLCINDNQGLPIDPDG